MSSVDGYLAVLGVERPSAPTLEALVEIHRRHLDRVSYENLGIMLGRPPSVAPDATLARIVEVGRAGYCFHHNGALELVLRELGYDVRRWHGHVWTEPAGVEDDALNHLALVVSGLPSEANPGGAWWVDVGLGEGFRDPLPVVEGVHHQGGSGYRISHLDADGWRLTIEPRGTFVGVRVRRLPAAAGEVEDAHRALTTPPSHFTRLLVAQRRGESGVDMVRGCVATSATTSAEPPRVLQSYDDWRDAIGAVGVPLDDLDEDELRALHARMWRAHLDWQAVADA